MQDRNPRERREPYAGRFASPDAGARPRGTTPAKPRAASSDARARRPSGFAAPEPPKRSAAASAPEAKEEPGKAPGLFARLREARESKRDGKFENKRFRASRLGRWEKLMIALIALALIVLAIALIFGGDRTYHQMPNIVYEGDSSYAPEASALPAEAAGNASGAANLAEPGAEAAGAGGMDWSQYLVTPEPGANLNDAAAAAGANYDAANGAGNSSGAGE